MSTSIMAEKAARREWNSVMEPNKVHVDVKVAWMGNICLPNEDGDSKVEAVFKTFTVGDNQVLEKATHEFKEVANGRKVGFTDPNEFRRLMVKKNLVWWSLGSIECEDGWMTQESYARVSAVPAPLLEALVNEFEKSLTISDEEEDVIQRQSAVLFSKNGTGVAEACEAVSQFCTLGNFWEKFGLDRDALPEMPFLDFVRLKIMMGKEGESMRSQSRATQASPTRVAGRGGKIRQSRGTRTSG